MKTEKLFMSSIVVLFLLIGGFVLSIGILPKTAEAGPTKITFVTYFYQCVTFDGGSCIQPTTWMNDTEEESWWHRNWRHQDNHPVVFDEISHSRTEMVDGCSQCSGTI